MKTWADKKSRSFQSILWHNIKHSQSTGVPKWCSFNLAAFLYDFSAHFTLCFHIHQSIIKFTLPKWNRLGYWAVVFAVVFHYTEVFLRQAAWFQFCSRGIWWCRFWWVSASFLQSKILFYLVERAFSIIAGSAPDWHFCCGWPKSRNGGYEQIRRAMNGVKTVG